MFHLFHIEKLFFCECGTHNLNKINYLDALFHLFHFFLYIWLTLVYLQRKERCGEGKKTHGT